MKRHLAACFLTFSLLAMIASRPIAAADASSTVALSFDVNKAIAAGDHKGLADYYKAQAAAYRQKAAAHDTMHADYKASLVHYKGMENTFTAHCEILKQKALDTAKEYDDLAAAEEKMIQPKSK